MGWGGGDFIRLCRVVIFCHVMYVYMYVTFLIICKTLFSYITSRLKNHILLFDYIHFIYSSVTFLKYCGSISPSLLPGDNMTSLAERKNCRPSTIIYINMCETPRVSWFTVIPSSALLKSMKTRTWEFDLIPNKMYIN